MIVLGVNSLGPKDQMFERRVRIIKKIKKSFTEDSLQFHQQKSASRLTQEFVGRPAYSYKDHSSYTISKV